MKYLFQQITQSVIKIICHLRPFYTFRLVHGYHEAGYKEAQMNSKFCQRCASLELKLQLFLIGNILFLLHTSSFVRIYSPCISLYATYMMMT